MTRISNNDAVVELKSALERDGVRAAIVFLNSLTSHRFTSLYQFSGETLRNITFYDRENPDSRDCEDIPVQASYCVFVRDTQSPFILEDSASDPRVRGHAKREVVQCYCGVPLVGSDGKLFGSACHFDLAPGRVSDDDVELLEHLATLLEDELH